MRTWHLPKLLFIVLLCAAMWTAAAAAAMCVGSTGKVGWPEQKTVLRERTARVLQASLVGAGLAGAGVAFQAVLRNALADPYLLGISSGSALGSYIWRLPLVGGALMAIHPLLGAASQQVFTFTGGALSALLVLAVAGWRGRLEPAVLVLVGVIVSTIVAALLLLIHTLVKTMPGSGSYQAVLIGELIPLAHWQLNLGGIISGVCVFELLRRSGRLNLTSLGDDEAQTLGLDVRRERWAIMILASLLTATAVALSGPIGFVGLICPHLARLVVGPDNRRLFPASLACGGALLALADAAARYLAATGRLNTVLPIGVITSLLGGPFFLMLLLKRRERV